MQVVDQHWIDKYGIPIIQLGPDEVETWDYHTEWTELKWIVYYYYHTDGDESLGQAVALGKNGLLYIKDMNHGTQDGPMNSEGFLNQPSFTIKEFWNNRGDIHFDIIPELQSKVIELIVKDKMV